jgi:hypothetical protein
MEIYDLVKIIDDDSIYRIERGTLYSNDDKLFIKNLETQKTKEINKKEILNVVGHWH